MRVRVMAVTGEELEGDVIGGEVFNEALDYCDLSETFTLRSDEGAFYAVAGWMVTATLMVRVAVN